MSSFTVICFADLKKYKFTYLFAFPALHSGSSWKVVPKVSFKNFSAAEAEENGAPSETGGQLSGKETTALVDAVQTWRYGVDARQYGFFLAKKRQRGSRWTPAGSDIQAQESNSRPNTPGTPKDELTFEWIIDALASYEEGFFNGVQAEDRFICFADPSTYDDFPGWMLRNLLILIRKRWKLERVQILCYRDVQSRRHEAHSKILNLEINDSEGSGGGPSVSSASEMPKVTGWERNDAGKFISKIANLGEYMDPQRLADQAVDLNLKLIKWRIAPNLELDKIKHTKCLLLGAGTLGSYVARNLMVRGYTKSTSSHIADKMINRAGESGKSRLSIMEVFHSRIRSGSHCSILKIVWLVEQGRRIEQHLHSDRSTLVSTLPDTFSRCRWQDIQL